MKLNISSLLENEYIDDGEGSLSGDSVPETSGIAVGTMQYDKEMDRYYLPFDFRFTQNFDTSNYLSMGISQYKIIRAMDKIPNDRKISAPAIDTDGYFVRMNVPENYFDEAEFITDEKNLNADKEITGAYTVYGYAQSENGLYYPIVSGSPLKFWLNDLNIKVVNITDSAVTVHLTGLEQPASLENYKAVGITTKPFVQGKPELKDENGKLLNYAETSITFTSDNDDFMLRFNDMPYGRTITAYIYKKNFLGMHYLLGTFSATIKENKVPYCDLGTEWYDEPFSRNDGRVTGVVKNCPHISSSDYKLFCQDINAVRNKSGIGNYNSFIEISSGDAMGYDVFHNIYTAIRDIYTNKYWDWPDIYPQNIARKNGTITKDFIYGMETALRNARDKLYGG